MIPIIFIHKGNSSYLFNTIYQLRQTNPLIKAYFIGTAESKVYEPLVEHVLIDSLFDEANQFADLYRHFSTNSEEFELICIQRWFVLKAFMIQNNIQRCLYIDSDVLIYDDVQVLSDQFKYVGMTICGISGHTNFVEKDVIVDFCQFVFLSYTGKEALNVLEKHYMMFVAQHGAGGVSDMTFLTKYAHENPLQVSNSYYTDGKPTFDPSLGVGSDTYKMDGYIKSISFLENKPYGSLILTDKSVLFYTLHFQGVQMKKKMSNYVINKGFKFYHSQFYYKVKYYLQKINLKRLLNNI